MIHRGARLILGLVAGALVACTPPPPGGGATEGEGEGEEGEGEVCDTPPADGTQAADEGAPCEVADRIAYVRVVDAFNTVTLDARFTADVPPELGPPRVDEPPCAHFAPDCPVCTFGDECPGDGCDAGDECGYDGACAPIVESITCAQVTVTVDGTAHDFTADATGRIN
jgi:hypothetical protein